MADGPNPETPRRSRAEEASEVGSSAAFRGGRREHGGHHVDTKAERKKGRCRGLSFNQLNLL
jgi:hypothetical protein